MIRDENGVQEDTSAVSTYAGGSAVVKTYQLDCHDGHEFSLESGAVAGCSVEFKHEDDVLWVNIETTPFDLSTWAGTTETFLMRYTPSATEEPQALKFRKGPA